MEPENEPRLGYRRGECYLAECTERGDIAVSLKTRLSAADGHACGEHVDVVSRLLLDGLLASLRRHVEQLSSSTA